MTNECSDIILLNFATILSVYSFTTIYINTCLWDTIRAQMGEDPYLVTTSTCSLKLKLSAAVTKEKSCSSVPT